MEPLDPAKTNENSGFSKRRISSILKAPRKSIVFPDPVQQEKAVECAKPVEKRNSRRVSFAAANDVLLFSKDVKNASPVRSPLQELMTTTGTTQNRVQVAVTEDGIQRITGMETLLNAPLHVSQQRNKVNFDSGNDFGEKTVMFAADDAVMDMTHSHTINIANDEELLAGFPHQKGTIFSSSGGKMMMFSTDDASMDMTLSHAVNMTTGSEMLSTGKNMDISFSSSVPGLDPGFKNLLASLSKPSGSSVNPVITRMTPTASSSSSSSATVDTNISLTKMKTQWAEVDKENQASSVMEMSQNKPRNIVESSYGGALCPEDDISMDMTETQTGRIVGFADDDDDPFQCLFPTQEMYSRSDRVSKSAENLKTSQQQSSKTQGSSEPKAVTTGNMVQKVITAGGSQQITDLTSLKNPSLYAPRQSMSKVNFDPKDECREKTIRFTADDAFMDVTQSHTVNIANGPFAPPNQSLDVFRSCGKMDSSSSLEERQGAAEKGFNTGFKNFLANLSKPNGPSVNPVIARMVPTAVASSKETVDTNVASSVLSLDPGFKNFLASLSKPSGSSVNPVITRMTPTASSSSATVDTNISLTKMKTQWTEVDKENQASSVMEMSQNKPRNIVESSYGGALCPEDDISMDMTETQTGRIVGFADDDDDPFQCLFPTQEMYSRSDRVSKSAENLKTSQQQSSKTQGSSEPKAVTTGNMVQKVITERGSQQITDLTSWKSPSLYAPRKSTSKVKFDTQDNCSEKTVRFSANDAAMDVTQSHTVNIATDLKPWSHQNVDFLPTDGEKTVRFTATDAMMDVTQSHTVNIATDLKPQLHQNVDFRLPTCGEKTVRFTANDAMMDVTQSHTVNIATGLEPQSHQNVDFLPACGEKTVRFTATDAMMDVTRSLTVNIATDLKPQSHQNVDFLPACGEKTVKFTATDAAMDVTRSHTVNIATGLEPQLHQNVDFLPACGEKTVRFTATDAAMDVTRSHTVNIATDLKPQLHQNVDFLPTDREKTVRFTATDAVMDVTRSLTVNIATDSEPQLHQNVDFLPTDREKTVRFTATDAAMDVTRSLTVNIATDLVSDSVLLQKQGPNILSTGRNMDFPVTVKKRGETSGSQRNRSLSALSLDPGFKNVLSKTTGSWANPVTTKTVETSFQEADANSSLGHLQTQRAGVNNENEAPGIVSAIMEKSVNKTTKSYESSNGNSDHSEDDGSMNKMEAQTGCILGETCTDEPPQCLSSTQDSYNSSDPLKKTDVSEETLGPSKRDAVGITNLPDSPESNETGIRKEPELRNETSPLSQKLKNSPSVVDHDVDAFPARKSRRKSLADLQSKVRRLSQMINASPDIVALDSRTAPLPQLDRDFDKDSKDKTKSLPVEEPEIEMGLVNTEENTQAQCLLQEELPTTVTTPFKLKTKQLMSRLSMGGFKPKLPQRSKTGNQKKVDSSLVNTMGEHTRTITINSNQLSNVDHDVSDIYDEELGSCEDLSETLDTRSPQKIAEEVSPSEAFNMDEAFGEDVCEEDFLSAVHGQKRPLPEDENNTEDEKRMKASIESCADFVEMSHVTECDGNIITAASTTAQTIDSSNNTHTASIRCEATFESTFKQSMFESQLEDYASDIQKKLDDGTITVLEFFKLFNIDFAIHNSRQSVLPGRLLTDTDRTPMDLLKDRHIIRPKQMVYETDVLNLTEQVEGLKVRMRDLDKPLKVINRPLWEEMRRSSEKEFKSFGAKLKERNNFFRKMSKVHSHEMKEVLYSNLVQANQEEQQKLRATIDEADEMIKNLDNYIHDFETELAVVEEKGADDKPSLKSHQEGLMQITEALADKDRQIAELEMQKNQNSSDLNRLKAETRNLEIHVAMLHIVNEWRVGEKSANCAVYTFLHETLHLQLVYANSNGNDADNETDRKISDITFKYQLDDEKSQCHAHLVHKLLSQYIEGETAWVEKYPTHRHVPKLLHDISLVVSHCRLLGEELRLLKKWGSLRLDILDISCVDTRVRIVFSSLKKFSKFEVIFSVSLTEHLYVLQAQSFKNMIGSTTIQQIEEIVASFSPARNLLTKIVKKIHENLLR